MPLQFMRRLCLECTSPCKYMLPLDSRTVGIIGYIKNLTISFNQDHDVSMIMHVMVVDIPEVYGMIFRMRVVLQSQKGFYFMEGTHFTFPHKGVEVVIRRESKY